MSVKRTLPKKFEIVHRNTTQSSNIRPSVCLATPARSPLLFGCGVSSSLVPTNVSSISNVSGWALSIVAVSWVLVVFRTDMVVSQEALSSVGLLRGLGMRRSADRISWSVEGKVCRAENLRCNVL